MDLTGKQSVLSNCRPAWRRGHGGGYKAYQPSWSVTSAIKVRPSHMATSEVFLNRFRREAICWRNFNTRTFYRCSITAIPTDTPISLAVRSQRHPGFFSKVNPAPQLVRRAMALIGDALASRPRARMIHRDIKPSKVLMDESGNCLLTVLGWRAWVESSSVDLFGNRWGPPLKCRGTGAGSRLTRCGSLIPGAFVRNGTGRVPYNAETPIAIVFKHIQDPLPSAEETQSRLPNPSIVLFKALAKSPVDRYQTVEGLSGIQAAIPVVPAGEM